MAASPMNAVINKAGKLWKTFCLQPGAMSNTEIVAIQRLMQSHSELKQECAGCDDGIPTYTSTCSSFLDNLAAAATAIGVPAAPRHYRRSFTPNYQAIFSDCSRNYRVDVLEGCLEESPSIWVNGDQFDLSLETMTCADELRRVWTQLGCMLDTCDQQCSAATRQELAKTLHIFDVAWANLEYTYIKDLIKIEDKAREMVMQAVELDAACSNIEGRLSPQIVTSSELQEMQGRFVQCIGRLNAVANYKRKGRDDFSAEILQSAIVIQRTRLAMPHGCNVAEMLSADVIQSFEAMRQYLRQISKCMESLDPHLCHNKGLVARLVDWEESWEIGHRYLTNSGLLKALSDLVDFIIQAQALEPKLAQMCEDCDVELFLVLPRLLVLRYLFAPESQRELLKELLPHKVGSSHEEEIPLKSLRTLQKLRDDFQHTQAALSSMWTSAGYAKCSAVNAESMARETLMRIAVEGFEEDLKVGRLADRNISICLDKFMRDLEEWSIEVQRHRAEDWNQCAAIVVQCLSGKNKSSSQQEQLIKFEV